MQTTRAPVVIVVGMGTHTRAIGKENGLMWHVPDDLKRFKSLTMGHPVIMGRKTFESVLSVLGKPFPGRTNIVVTRNPDYAYEGVAVAQSFDDALEKAQSEGPAEIHIGGGEEIYRLALPYADRLHVTYYDDDSPGDAHFPPFETDFEEIKREPPREYEGIRYQWVDYARKNPS